MKDGTPIVSYSWNWDDDSDVEVVDRKTISHTFESIGTYTVILSVVDNVGRTSSTSTEIAVDIINDPPFSCFTYYEPEHWQPGASITFDASCSSDPDGDPLTYTWDWGYGPVSENLTDPVTTHQFNLEDECEVSLTVSDGNGLMGVADLVSLNFGYPYGNQPLAHISLGDLVWDFAVDGDYMYVAAGSEGLRVIDISNPSSPAVYPDQFTFNEPARWVRTCDDRLVVMTRRDEIEPHHNSTVFMFDISSPSNPVQLGSYAIQNDTVRGITMNSDYVFVTTSKGVYILDFGDPENPEETQILENSTGFYDICLRENFLFTNNSNNIRIYDISDPYNPEFISRFPESNALSELGFVLEDDLMYVMHGGLFMTIVDVSDPANPTRINKIQTFAADRMTLAEPYAILANMNGDALSVVDVSDPSTAEYICTFTPIIQSRSLQGVENYLYIGGGEGFSIIDMTEPRGPRYLTRFTSEFQSLYDTEIHNGLIYSCGYEYLLEITDISDPLNPLKLSSILGPSTSNSIAVHNNLALVGTRYDGLYIFDVSDPRNPYMLSRINYNSFGCIYDIFIVDDLAFISPTSAQCVIIDISDPHNPTETGRYDNEEYTQDGSIAVRGDLCYVTAVEDPSYNHIPWLYVLDTSDPENIELIWSTSEDKRASYYLDVSGDYLYLYVAIESSDNRVDVYDISGDIPVYAGEIEVPIMTYTSGVIHVLGDYMYLSKDGRGLNIYDVSDPQDILLVSHMPTDTTYTSGINIERNIAVLASSSIDREGYNIIQLW